MEGPAPHLEDVVMRPDEHGAPGECGRAGGSLRAEHLNQVEQDLPSALRISGGWVKCEFGFS
jgi:hypothetical protein